MLFSQSTPPTTRYPHQVAMLIMGLGSAVLVGWVADIAVLKSFVPGLIEMKVNTAIAFILAGCSLWLQAHPTAPQEQRWLGRACAVGVLSLGAGSLSEWVFGWNLHIDQLFFLEPTTAVYTSAVGRMAPNTALNFICDGLALLLIDWRWGRARPAQILCFIELVMAMLALLVYVYGVGKVFGILQFTPMAVHTAIGFILLSTGILWARSDCGPMTLVVSRTSGGTLIRRLLPVVIFAPLLIAWLCLQGISAGVIDTSFAFAIFAVATIVLLAVPIWFHAQAVFVAELMKQKQIEEAEVYGVELARINGALRELQNTKDLLTGMVIHDLRNPLTACLGYLEVVENKQRNMDPLVARCLARARESGFSLLNMINGIIDIMRMEDNQMPTARARTDVTALMAAKREQYVGAATQARLALVHHGSGVAIEFVTDGALIARVIDNLIINAIKHTPAGGTVTLAETLSPDTSALHIRIADTGEGISVDNLSRLFLKYGRIEGQSMGRPYDTGLGLVFCRMAVNLLQGTIRAESEKGKGSTFIIELTA